MNPAIKALEEITLPWTEISVVKNDPHDGISYLLSMAVDGYDVGDLPRPKVSCFARPMFELIHIGRNVKAASVGAGCSCQNLARIRDCEMHPQKAAQSMFPANTSLRDDT